MQSLYVSPVAADGGNNAYAEVASWRYRELDT
jgi:hypothetical protein